MKRRISAVLASLSACALFGTVPALGQSAQDTQNDYTVAQTSYADPRIPAIKAPETNLTISADEMRLAINARGFVLYGYACGLEAGFHTLATEIVDLRRAASLYEALSKATDRAAASFEALWEKVASDPKVDATPLSQEPQEVFDGIRSLLGTVEIFNGPLLRSRPNSVQAPDPLTKTWRDGPLDTTVSDRLRAVRSQGFESRAGFSQSGTGGTQTLSFIIDDCYRVTQLEAALRAHEEAAQAAKVAFDQLQASRQTLNAALSPTTK